MIFENTDKDAAFHRPAARSQSNFKNLIDFSTVYPAAFPANRDKGFPNCCWEMMWLFVFVGKQEDADWDKSRAVRGDRRHWEQTRIRRMRSTLLWLLAALAFASLTSPADGAPMWVDQRLLKWNVLGDRVKGRKPEWAACSKALRDWSHGRSSSVVIFDAFKPDTDLTLACISTLSVRLPYEMCFINKFDLTWLAKWGGGWHVFFCGGGEVVVGLDLILIYWPRAKFTHSKQILEAWRNAALIGSEFSVWFGRNAGPASGRWSWN